MSSTASTPRTHHRGRRSASTHRDWSARSTPETRPTARGQRRSRRYQRHAVLLALCPVAHICMPCPTLGLPNGEASSSLSSCVAAATHPEGTLLAAALSTYLDSTCWWRRDGWNVVAMDYVNPLWRNDGNRASSNSLKPERPWCAHHGPARATIPSKHQSCARVLAPWTARTSPSSGENLGRSGCSLRRLGNTRRDTAHYSCRSLSSAGNDS